MSKKRTRQQKLHAAIHRVETLHDVATISPLLIKKVAVNEVEQEKVSFLKSDLIKTLTVTVICVILLIALTQLT